MRVVLFVFSVLAFLAGAAILSAAKSAIHEIEAFILFLVSAVFLSGACIVDAILLLRNEKKVVKNIDRNS